MSPAFLRVLFCSAVIQIVKNTRGPEKFHAQIFSSRKLCKKAPTSIKKRFKYFRKIVVFSFFFFVFKCHFSFFLRFFNQQCLKRFFSLRAILPHSLLSHSLRSSPAKEPGHKTQRKHTKPLSMKCCCPGLRWGSVWTWTTGSWLVSWVWKKNCVLCQLPSWICNTQRRNIKFTSKMRFRTQMEAVLKGWEKCK